MNQLLLPQCEDRAVAPEYLSIRQYRHVLDITVYKQSSTVVKPLSAQFSASSIQKHPLNIEAQPGTCIGLIKTEDNAIEAKGIHSTIHEWIEDDASIANTAAKGVTGGGGHLKELSGDTLTPSEAGDCVQFIQDAIFPATTSAALKGDRLSRSAMTSAPVSKSEVLNEIFRHDSPMGDLISKPQSVRRQSPSTPASATAQSPVALQEKPMQLSVKAGSPSQSLFVSSPAVEEWPIGALKKMKMRTGLRLSRSPAHQEGDGLDTPTHGSPSSNDVTHVTPVSSSTTPPTTVHLGDRLHVCFPEHISIGVYEVQLDVGMSLSQPDASGWQSLIIPSLSTESDADRIGILDFSLVAPPGDDANVPSAQFDTTNCILVEDEQEGSLKGSFPANDCFSLPVRLKAAIHRLARWNSAIAIYSTVFYATALGIEVKHSASLTVDCLDEDIFAKRVALSILVKNGPRKGGIYRLQPRQCVVQLLQKRYAAAESHGPVEILIERDFPDVNKRLGLEFTCHYPDMEEATISLPVIKPKFGRVLSEKIWLLKPSPPLKLHAVSRPFLSTWQVNKRTVAQKELLCFNRMDMPTLYPDALADDAGVQIRRFHPTLFNGFHDPVCNTSAEGPCNVIPSLDMIVDIIPGRRIECRLFFDLEVGDHERLLQIDAIGWQPKYALINGHLSTKHYAPWWDEEFRMEMFKSSWMQPGEKLRVEMSFVVNGQIGEFTVDQGNWVEIAYPLPRVTDKIVLGGALTCGYNGAVIAVCHDNLGTSEQEAVRFRSEYGKDHGRLPSLNKDYTIRVEFSMFNPARGVGPQGSRPPPTAETTRFSGGIPLQPRRIRFEDENSNPSNDDDDQDAFKNAALSTGPEKTARDIHRYSPDGLSESVPLVDRNRLAAEEVEISDREVNSSARGEDTPSSSDEHGSQPENLGASSDEDEEDDNDRHGDGGDAAGALLDYLFDVALDIVRYLERRSPMQYLIRFLILECIVCLGMPWAYFGGQPARTAQSMVSSVFTSPGQMFLGDLDPSAQPTSGTGLDDVLESEEARDDIHLVMGGYEQYPGQDITRGTRGQSWRDRIDLALGWRPVV
ncbi:MAG: hypothetical protein LQ338_001946 [Usnochroma carphineum]|nr:MAG: hypothetical protein LQ338_001946 [Usnochroma carphineum]